MALIGNRSVLLKSPGRFLSGTVASIERNNFATAGQLASRFQAMDPALGGIPNGHLSPSSWAMPRTPGAISSRNNAAITITVGGSVSRGLPLSGSADISITAVGAAEAVGSVAGDATISITAVGDAYAQAVIAGSANVTITAPGSVGAIAYVEGSANILLTAASTMGCVATVAGAAYLSGAAEGATLTEASIAAATVAALEATTIPVNVRKVNDLTVDGSGTEVDPWGPA